MKTSSRLSNDLIEPLEARIAPATFVVNSLLDGAPAKDGKLTLREALEAATSNTAVGDAPAGDTLADTITFAPALAGGTIQLTGPLVIVGGGQLSIVGPGTSAGAIVISAEGTNDRVLTITDTVDAVLLSHLTLTNGNIAGAGGGIFNNGTLYLDDVLVTKNTAFDGGGIENEGAAAKLSIVNSRLQQNTATNGNGGGILNTGTGAQLTIRNSTIVSNSGLNGAGVFSDMGTTAAISASKITGNRGGNGGNGAGIFNLGTLTLDETTVSGNVGVGSSFFGGGIYNDVGTLQVLASTISNNLAGQGGGFDINSGTVTVINSTIADNTAVGSVGGGITTFGTLSITNSTIVGNVDANSNSNTGAGGISVQLGTPHLVNTVVAGNFEAAGTSADVRGSFDSGSLNNFIGVGDNATGLTNGTNGNQVGTSGAPIDPKLGPLQDNGGLTYTMEPLVGSPLIDMGFSSIGDLPHTDQRGPGFSRDVDIPGVSGGTGQIDIGAVEAAGTPSAAGVTSFTFTQTGGDQINVSLTGGGTFDLFLDAQDQTIADLDIHSATPSSQLTVKALTAGATENVAAIHADGPLKSVTLGKGMVLTGSIGVEGALGSLALDTMTGTPFIRTGGTPSQMLSIKTNGDFTAVMDTTSAVGKLSLPKFHFTGAIRAASIGDIAALSFDGTTTDDAFNLGDNTHQDLIATSGPVGKLSTTNGTFTNYDIQAGPGSLGTFGGLAVKIDTGGSSVTGIETVSATAASIGAIVVKASGPNGVTGIDASSFVATNGQISGVAVSLTIPTNDTSTTGIGGSVFTAAAGIGPVTVTAKQLLQEAIDTSTFGAGTTTLATWATLPTAKLQAAALKNSSLGAIKVNGEISDSTLVAAGNIGSVTAPSLFDATILAGASLGADQAIGGTGANADIYVRPVTIGAITTSDPSVSIISAGVDPGPDGAFGDGDDVAGLAGLITTGSKIGALKFTGADPTVSVNGAIVHKFVIQAAAIAKITVKGMNITPTAAGIVIDDDGVPGDGVDDTLIRLL